MSGQRQIKRNKMKALNLDFIKKSGEMINYLYQWTQAADTVFRDIEERLTKLEAALPPAKGEKDAK